MNEQVRKLITKLNLEKTLTKAEWVQVLQGQDAESMAYAAELACKAREPFYGNQVFLRGLIEFTNYCKNNCYYCGIRAGNTKAHRYRLSLDEIMACCKEGYRLGFRTFVLQGGEDPYYTDEKIVEIVSLIRKEYPDCAITLSIGEKEKESYRRFKEAGAERYLLRHETANEEHYRKLHPEKLSHAHRMQCLRDLKELGYQVGAGFMVGAPYQTVEHLAEDMIFLKDLNPAMIGIGPFIPHHETCFADEPAGTLDQTLYCLSLLRIMIPKVLLPATTALGTIDPLGREKGMKSGANVVMPNLSPTEVRKDYLLYDNKICTGDESAQCRHCMEMRMKRIGYEIAYGRGDALNMEEKA